MGELPRGTVTFLFTDIEGSTQLLHRLGDRYADALMEHRATLRAVFRRHDGVEVGTEGDSFFVAFATASDAAAAALAGQEALVGAPVRVRMGIHTGEPLVVENDYVGIDVHRAARISAAAHGGQIVLSERTRSFLTSASPVRDLGLHRLKDIAAPERLFQLGAGDFPPLRSMNASNLPVQTERLIGREREIDELSDLVMRKRVVTLTGPGGTGKTRLAVQTAAGLVDRFPHGVFWVPLAAIRDADLVVPAVGDVLGAQIAVEAHIGDKRMLIVLDNMEQILDAAPRLAELIACCANLRLIITSRAPLRINGEQEYPVETLPVPDAVALFRERANDGEPSEVVAEICRRVDCLPLAVELAAARTRVFSTRQLLERLERRLPLLEGGRRDLPERQRTLRATIEWSYDLLPPNARKLFARLGVCAGSCDIETVETVCDANLEDLARLVEESLVRREADRFSMLETIREYAVDQLNASPDAGAVRDRHAQFFLRLAERGRIELTEGDPAVWIRRMTDEDDNLRAAIGWSIETGNADVALRICSALARGWEMRSRIDEGVRWFERALSVEGASPEPRARALEEAGRLMVVAGRFAEAIRMNEQSVAGWRALDDRVGLGRALNGLGSALSNSDRDAARPVLMEALEIARATNDLVSEESAVHLLGEIFRDLGDYETAAAHLERSILLAKELGRRISWGASVHSLADLELDRRDLARAQQLYRDCLRNGVECQLHRHVVYCLAGLAATSALDGRSERASVLWNAVERAEQALEFRLLGAERDRYTQIVEPVRDPVTNAPDLDEAVELALRD